MKISVIHAPSANFATSTTITVIAVTKPPKPLTSALLNQCGPRFFRQCITMPNCDKVNARNAPTAYRGIRLSVIPPKAISRMAVKTAKTTIP